MGVSNQPSDWSGIVLAPVPTSSEPPDRAAHEAFINHAEWLTQNVLQRPDLQTQQERLDARNVEHLARLGEIEATLRAIPPGRLRDEFAARVMDEERQRYECDLFEIGLGPTFDPSYDWPCRSMDDFQDERGSPSGVHAERVQHSIYSESLAVDLRGKDGLLKVRVYIVPDVTLQCEAMQWMEELSERYGLDADEEVSS